MSRLSAMVMKVRRKPGLQLAGGQQGLATPDAVPGAGLAEAVHRIDQHDGRAIAALIAVHGEIEQGAQYSHGVVVLLAGSGSLPTVALESLIFGMAANYLCVKIGAV